MTIMLRNYLTTTTDAETGQLRPFGKVGFTAETPKTDKFTRENLRAIERALDSGQLPDINGEPCKDRAVIQVLCVVTKVDDSATIEQVASITGFGGATVDVPAAPPAESEAPEKLF